MVGIGLHCGSAVNVRLRPMDVNGGIVFCRTDLEKAEIKISSYNVSDTRLATTLSANGAEVGTVEHFLSVLAVLGIDNLLIELDKPELPILDGSSSPWLLFLSSACGISSQQAAKRYILVKKPVTVADGKRRVSFTPNDNWASYKVDIDYPYPVVQRGGSHFSHTLSYDEYDRDIAAARTFCHISDVEYMKKSRRASGGSLANAIVHDDNEVINKEGLRYKDEFVRHKMLDSIGDCYINGHLILCDYEGIQPGHDLNNRLMRALLSDKDAWEYVDAD